jgi:hypothetical protein
MLSGMTPGRLFLLLAAFLAAGVPIVGFLWHGLNQVVAGDLARLVVVLPLAAVLAGFLVLFARTIRRLEEQ